MHFNPLPRLTHAIRLLTLMNPSVSWFTMQGFFSKLSPYAARRLGEPALDGAHSFGLLAHDLPQTHSR